MSKIEFRIAWVKFANAVWRDLGIFTSSFTFKDFKRVLHRNWAPWCDEYNRGDYRGAVQWIEVEHFYYTGLW